MALTLPQLIVMKLPKYDTGHYAYYQNDGSVFTGEKSVFDTTVKIEVERSANNDNYVHLRFSYSNKYWQKSTDNNFIVAQSNKPEEDTSKPSCTLFEVVKENDEGKFTLRHVQSGLWLLIDETSLGLNLDASFAEYFSYINWDALVKFPTNSLVAFKGDNGYYLRAHTLDGNQLLQFGSDDRNDQYSAHRIELRDDGYIVVWTEYYDKYWKADPWYVFVNTTTPAEDDYNTMFWPVKGEGDTIALRSRGNDLFCKRYTENNTYADMLNASDPSISSVAKIVVEELVSERNIFNVNYQMDDARIFDETPYIAGTTTLKNISDVESNMSDSITFQKQASYTFNRSLSLSTGVTTKFTAGVPGIEETSIEISFTINSTLDWGTTTTTSTSITATGGALVPPKSKVELTYVGTQGTCNIPFHYTQQDRSSKDGSVTHTDQIDGIYTGVNCYNFYFVVGEPQPLI